MTAEWWLLEQPRECSSEWSFRIAMPRCFFSLIDLSFSDTPIIDVINAHDNDVTSIDFSDHASTSSHDQPMFLASGGRDRFVHVFRRVPYSSQFVHCAVLDGHQSSIKAVKFAAVSIFKASSEISKPHCRTMTNFICTQRLPIGVSSSGSWTLSLSSTASSIGFSRFRQLPALETWLTSSTSTFLLLLDTTECSDSSISTRSQFEKSKEPMMTWHTAERFRRSLWMLLDHTLFPCALTNTFTLLIWDQEIV